MVGDRLSTRRATCGISSGLVWLVVLRFDLFTQFGEEPFEVFLRQRINFGVGEAMVFKDAACSGNVPSGALRAGSDLVVGRPLMEHPHDFLEVGQNVALSLEVPARVRVVLSRDLWIVSGRYHVAEISVPGHRSCGFQLPWLKQSQGFRSCDHHSIVMTRMWAKGWRVPSLARGSGRSVRLRKRVLT